MTPTGQHPGDEPELDDALDLLDLATGTETSETEEPERPERIEVQVEHELTPEDAGKSGPKVRIIRDASGNRRRVVVKEEEPTLRSSDGTLMAEVYNLPPHLAHQVRSGRMSIERALMLRGGKGKAQQQGPTGTVSKGWWIAAVAVLVVTGIALLLASV